MSAPGTGRARTGAPAAPRAAPARARGPRYPDRTLWVNGELARGERAALSLFDRGARTGEGLLETFRVYGGQPFLWDRHMERLVLSAAVLGFPVPPAPARLRHGLAQLLAAEGLLDAVARLVVTRGVPGGRPTRAGAWIEAEPVGGHLWPGTRRGAADAIVSRTPFHPGPLGAHKTTSRLAYSLALEEARAARADEALLAAPDGTLLEGATSNLFVVRRGEVLTPPLARGILPGIARAVVLELCAALGLPAREADLSRADLAAADEAFVTNSVQEVVPLATVDGAPLPGRVVGQRLLAAYRERVARGG
uniref:Aminodeoxychorismate lyase n=1 Tax=Eiseniibacteriota bacterium TaxID=2212470 RepID=A0A832I418_UNCEI